MARKRKTRKYKVKKSTRVALSILLSVLLFVVWTWYTRSRDGQPAGDNQSTQPPQPTVQLTDIPAYSGNPYVVINGNQPIFQFDELTAEGFEYYSELDALGRCGYAYAICGEDTNPPEGDTRGDIGHVKPSGWINHRYDTSVVSGGYIYNRCHLIGWQLTDEDDNERNLITGTRYLNIEGMLPFENEVDDHIEQTSHHVAYRVTPIYEGNNLVCSGVQMEAYCVNAQCEEVCFNVYCYNVQPGITIDYATGENWLTE